MIGHYRRIKSNPLKSVKQSSHYNKTTRLKSHDTSKDSIFGRVSPRTCNRIRGFSARYDKSIATESGATVNRADVERRRAFHATKMHAGTLPDNKRSASIESCIAVALHIAQSFAQCAKVDVQNSLSERWSL
jgi:hypothetical protein